MRNCSQSYRVSVAVLILDPSARLWGSRLCTVDPPLATLCHPHVWKVVFSLGSHVIRGSGSH